MNAAQILAEAAECGVTVAEVCLAEGIEVPQELVPEDNDTCGTCRGCGEGSNPYVRCADCAGTGQKLPEPYFDEPEPWEC